MNEKAALILSKTNVWRTQATLHKAELLASEKRLPAEIYIQYWSSKQRRQRAFKTFLIFMMLALVSVLIPIMHFVLVPLFVLASLSGPFFVYHKKSVVLGGVGTCPHCAELFEIMGAADRWPLHDICAACRKHVSVQIRPSV